MLLLLQHQRTDGEIDTYHLKPGRRYHIGRGSGCEVRLLDLKLSRKHGAVEYTNGAWRFIDLSSTNGCRVNGETMVGSLVVDPGMTIEMGSTILVATRIIDPDREAAQEQAAAQAAQAAPVAKKKEPSSEFPPAESPAVAAKTQEPLTATRTQEPTPMAGTRQPSDEWLLEPPAQPTRAASLEPKPGVAKAPEPGRTPPPPPTAIRPVRVNTSPIAEDLAATQPAAMKPMQTPLPVAGADTGEATFFITLLGTRIGPLTRTQARDLKSRELKGVLRPGDLDGYPKA